MHNRETERKYLVDREKWSRVEKPEGTGYIQGYLSIDEDRTVRVRVAGDKGFLTIKGKSETFSHPEFEYAIPVEDALEMLRLFTQTQVKKIRTRIQAGAHVWEVDEFQGDNDGLIMAEIELENPDDLFEKPDWITKEVTGDKRYYNAYLSINPYLRWKK
ncbi:MAG: CYTH domain-containing protein [Bacteroidales bacterium]|jgi:CYTH domain-containing protein|nr:CYTH domain-containing protein [Bacteroidales bacterium]